MDKKAFTLIELLVVISIIALLLAILMPALKAAKNKAMELYSISNMRSLAVAWSAYTHSNNSKLVGGQVWHNLNENTNPLNKSPNGIRPFDWVYPVDPSGSAVSDHEKELEAIRKGGLWPYIENTKVYHSPGDKNWDKSIGTYTTQTSPYRSYAISDAMNGMWYKDYSYQRLGKIHDPSGKMVFTEEEDQGGNNWGSWVLGSPGTNSWWDPLAAWYNKGTTSIFGYADGHADKHVWQEKHTKDWIKTQNLGHECPDDQLKDIQFMIKSYHHKYY